MIDRIGVVVVHPWNVASRIGCLYQSLAVSLWGGEIDASIVQVLEMGLWYMLCR
jgi:hypothetical protein